MTRMDVVYILGNGSKHGDIELRYSLRSLEKYVPFRKVFIVGERPDFLNGKAVHIPNSPGHSNKARNIMENVLAACNHPDLSDDFLFVNDDYFFTGPLDPETYPFYYKCDLKQTAKIQHNDYRKHVVPTIRALEEYDLLTLNFDTHFPIRYNKDLMRQVIPLYNWERPHGFVLKSLYCNTIGVPGQFRLDCKFYKPAKPDFWKQVATEQEVFSIADACLNNYLKAYLKEAHPDKSRFEL